MEINDTKIEEAKGILRKYLESGDIVAFSPPGPAKFFRIRIKRAATLELKEEIRKAIPDIEIRWGFPPRNNNLSHTLRNMFGIRHR